MEVRKKSCCDSPLSLMPSPLLLPSGAQSNLFRFQGYKPTYTERITAAINI